MWFVWFVFYGNIKIGVVCIYFLDCLYCVILGCGIVYLEGVVEVVLVYLECNDFFVYLCVCVYFFFCDIDGSLVD